MNKLGIIKASFKTVDDETVCTLVSKPIENFKGKASNYILYSCDFSYILGATAGKMNNIKITNNCKNNDDILIITKGYTHLHKGDKQNYELGREMAFKKAANTLARFHLGIFDEFIKERNALVEGIKPITKVTSYKSYTEETPKATKNLFNRIKESAGTDEGKSITYNLQEK